MEKERIERERLAEEAKEKKRLLVEKEWLYFHFDTLIHWSFKIFLNNVFFFRKHNISEIFINIHSNIYFTTS